MRFVCDCCNDLTNIEADRMEIQGEKLMVYSRGRLVYVADLGQIMLAKLMSIGTSRNHANWGLTAKPRWKTNAGVVEDTLTIALYAKLLRARMEGKKDG